jgi:AcrR family transcriptional regulator
MSPANRNPRSDILPGLPRGPHSLSREEVAANQRLRMILAMIDTTGEKGYVASTVADVIARAGVSRKAFYEHFSSKDDCFLAAFDEVAQESRRRVTNAYRGAKGWPGRVDAAIRALFEAAIDNPSAVRLGMIEVAAAGPVGVERRERAIIEYERVILNALELAPGRGAVPEIGLRMVVGGLNGILWRYVRRGETANLLEFVPDLVKWATSYYPTPTAILTHVPEAASKPPPLPGRRAPGTLSLGFPRTGHRGGNRERNISHSFIVHSQHERILDAVANLTATYGYAALKIDAIVSQAGVSIQTFYELFTGKEDAVLVAYEIGHLRSLGVVEHAFAMQPDWANGVRAAVHALFEFLACEPSFTHLAMLDAHVATPESARRAELGLAAYADMLLPGLKELPEQQRPPAVTVDAIMSGMVEIIFDHVVRRRVPELPHVADHVTYLVLAPFIGGDRAASVALGES